jgi:hypothetical protein
MEKVSWYRYIPSIIVAGGGFFLLTHKNHTLLYLALFLSLWAISLIRKSAAYFGGSAILFLLLIPVTTFHFASRQNAIILLFYVSTVFFVSFLLRPAPPTQK